MKLKKETIKKIITVSIFAIAMAFLENVIVIYLRKLYYPNGFNFPLASVDSFVFNVEFIRELFTIVMLYCIGYLAGKKFPEKFAYFLYSFAIWDIFYYVFLKLILNWPSSFLTWDLLFLIPFSWASPVLAPIICSITMIVLSMVLITLEDKKYKVKIIFREWSLLILGSIFILYTFLFDYGRIIFQKKYAMDYIYLMNNQNFLNDVGKYIPTHYNWLLFILGEILLIVAIGMIWKRIDVKR